MRQFNYKALEYCKRTIKKWAYIGAEESKETKSIVKTKNENSYQYERRDYLKLKS